MMRCGKLKTGSLFSRRLKFWFYGDVSLILADFGISMAHAQGRGSHGVAMQQQDGALFRILTILIICRALLIGQQLLCFSVCAVMPMRPNWLMKI
jgi:hypothetical protein